MIQMEALNNCILLALLAIVVVVSGEATYNGWVTLSRSFGLVFFIEFWLLCHVHCNRDTLLRTYPKTQSDRDFLNGIGASDISQYANMWGIPALDGLPVYIYVKVGGFDVTKAAFDKQNLAFETLIEDWQKYDDSISPHFPLFSWWMTEQFVRFALQQVGDASIIFSLSFFLFFLFLF